jgi:hypothetical protein
MIKKQTIKKTASATKKKAAPPPSVNLEDFMEEIRARANEIYLERADGPGDDLSDWLQAEKEVKKKYKIK